MSKKKHSAPKISPLATINFRISTFLASTDAASGDAATIYKQLDSLLHGIKPEQLISFLLPAIQSAPRQVSAHLTEHLVQWVVNNNLINNLKNFLVKEGAMGNRFDVADTWLANLDIDISTDINTKTSAAANLFVEAKAHGDNEWQCSIHALWYTDRRKYNQHGFCFLLDRNPPWNGAVKDFFIVEPSMVQHLLSRMRNDFNGINGPKLYDCSQERVKELLVKAFRDSAKAGLRMPHDLAEAKEDFWKFFQMLPQSGDETDFSREEYDTLFKRGKSVESLSNYEQNVGRYILDDNGKAVFVSADPAFDKFGDTQLLSDEEFGKLSIKEQEQYLIQALRQPDIISAFQEMQKREQEIEDTLNALSTDELWKRLSEAGFTDSQETLKKKALEAYSTINLATEYSEEIDAIDEEDDTLLLCGVPIMCKRLLPDVPFVEDVTAVIDEHLDRGYDWFEEDENYEENLDEWMFVWGELKAFIEKRRSLSPLTQMRSIEELDSAFESYNSMQTFLTRDLLELLDSIVLNVKHRISTAQTLIEEMAQTFDTKGDAGRMYILLSLTTVYAFQGNHAAMDKLFEDTAQEFPTKSLVYLCWASEVANPTEDNREKNPQRAIEIIERGLAVKGLDITGELEILLEEVRDEAGL
jgi:hypothetical protein